jgi:Tfp pilus assembly protein PilN
MASRRAERSLLWPGVLVGVGVAATVLLAGLLLLRGGWSTRQAAASRQDRNFGRR